MENDGRHEKRYAIKFPLLYSPTTSSFEENLGDRLFRAVTIDLSLSGLAFDVDKAIPVGDKINILPEKSGDLRMDALVGEICWCRQLSPGQYRIGVHIVSQSAPGELRNPDNSNFIGKDEMPKEIDYFCPSCEQATTFHFIGLQPLLVGKIVIPLYNCTECDTTRSLTGLLNP